MAARIKPRRIYNPAYRPIEFWDGLRGKGFVPHDEWWAVYKQLDDPRDKMAALMKLLEYGLPKPRIEDFEDTGKTDVVDVENSYRLLKELTQAKLEKECLTNLAPQQELSPQSPQQELPGASLLPGLQESSGT